MMMNGQDNNSKHYSMIIEWSHEDDAYIVTVPELPGCRTHGSTREEAVRMGEEVIERWLEGEEAVPLPQVFSYWPSFSKETGLHLIVLGDDDADAKHYQEEEVQQALVLVEEAKRPQPQGEA